LKAIPFLILTFLVYSAARSLEHPPSRSLTKPDVDAGTYVSKSDMGAIYRTPAVATSDRQTVYWVHDITSGIGRPGISTPPARFSVVPQDHGCDLIRPSPEAEVYFVYNSGGSEIPLHFLVFEGLIELSGQKHPLKPYVQSGPRRTDLHHRLDDSEAEYVDVLVTETRRPVYLVLSSYGTKVWSLHLAEGVKLEAVAVIGEHPQGLAHLPQGTAVRFVTSEGSPQRNCVITPVPPVTDDWRMVERQNDKHVASFWKKKVANTRAAHQDYHNWLVGRVGEPDHVVTAGDAEHMLVGPRPEKRLRFRSLKGAHILFAPAGWPAWGDRKIAADTLFQLVQNAQAR